MAIIEGVGDEVTILFGLVFIVLVLVLAWASTRTVDRGDQALQTAEDISASTSEQEVLPCTSTNQSPREGETIAKRTDAGCTAEEIEESADEKEEQSTGYTAEEIEESADEKEEQSEDEKEEQRTGCTAEEIEESEDEKEEQSEDEEREQQSEEAEERKQSEEERKQSEEQQEGEKGVEVEEEFRTKHETPPAEKGAEELVTDNVSEMDISPLDTMELRQRVTCTSGREETVSADVQPPDSDCAEGSSILLRLKFLNDTERIARVRPEDTIGQIKRIHFPHQEHQVRLIYQGQLLGDDTRTLSSLHIVNNCVVHCHISQNATPQSPAGSHAAEHTETTLNIGGLMLPVFFLMLSVLWYYQINYRQFFTAPATISLVGITILFSFVAFGAYRR